jgi:uncharacterized protein YajQ (UPF0234 family)
MPSFDIVSKVVWAEIDNALNQTQKEIAQRYDFKDTGTSVTKTPEGFVIVGNSEGRVEAALDVLKGKLVKRSVSLKHLDPQKPAPAGGQTYRQLLKVQASIQGDEVRVTGKNRDDLQDAMKLLRGSELDIELKFGNFRE